MSVGHPNRDNVAICSGMEGVADCLIVSSCRSHGTGTLQDKCTTEAPVNTANRLSHREGRSLMSVYIWC